MATLSPTRWSRFKTRRNGSQTRTGTTSTSLTRDSDERNILKNLIFINKSLSFWDAVLQLVGIWFLRKWLVYIKLTEGAQLAFGLGFTTPVNWMNFSISPNKSMSFAKEAAQNFVVFSASSRRPRLSWQRGNCWGPLWLLVVVFAKLLCYLLQERAAIVQLLGLDLRHRHRFLSGKSKTWPSEKLGRG